MGNQQEQINQNNQQILGQSFKNVQANSKFLLSPHTKHNQIMCYCHQKQQQFVDKACPYKSLLPQNSLQWKRIQKIFPTQIYRTKYWSFEYEQAKSSQYCTFENLRTAIKQLTEMKKYILKDNQQKYILKNICLNPQGQEMSKIGMYRFALYFCGIQQVAVDSFVPINHGQFFSDRPKKGQGIWMIMLEKSLAKVLGSYQRIKDLSSQQLFSQISGYITHPKQEQAYEKAVLGKLQFEPKKSLYYRLGNNYTMKYCLAFWFQLKLNHQEQIYYDQKNAKQNLVIQIIKKKYVTINDFEWIKQQTQMYADTQSRNIVKVMGKGRKYLQTNDSFIHIFNKSNRVIKCNLVVQANSHITMVPMATKQEINECRDAKIRIIKKIYIKSHQNLVYHKTANMDVKQLQEYHRILIQVRNSMDYSQNIKLVIKENFRQSLHFEDHPELTQRQFVVEKDKRCLFIIIRQKNIGYGWFYQLSGTKC